MKKIAGWLSMFCVVTGAGAAGAESLYREASFQPLIADARAHRPGDSLTVLVVENASAAASADTTTEKKGGLGVAAKYNDKEHKGSLELSEDSAGRGRIQRTGKLLAQITVTVQSVENNGELVVKGEQLLEFNNEKQQIRLEGRVRPRDIAPNNTVISTRIADARISYVGDGILGEKQGPGFLIRILSLLRFL